MRVFVSSTVEDLKPTGFRAAAESAIKRLEFAPVMMEYFEADGAKPALEFCLSKVRNCDVLVVIVAGRYGWIPPDQPGGRKKSITWLECDEARKNGIQVLSFFVQSDELAKRSDAEQVKDSLVSMEDEELLAARERARLLKQFRQELDINNSPRAGNVADFGQALVDSLHRWNQKRNPGTAKPKPADPQQYLQLLSGQCATIRIQGLRKGDQEAQAFPIDRIYIPVATASGAATHGGKRVELQESPRTIPLQQALPAGCRALVEGNAGQGKTTFLKRIAFALCQTELGTDSKAAEQFFGRRAFPIKLEAADLARHIREQKDAKPHNSPQWLCHYLDHQSREFDWNLDGAFFHARLVQGPCLVMVDALDEVPTEPEREQVARIVEQAARTFPKADFIATIRPYAPTTLFRDARVSIAPIEPEQMRGFIRLFAKAYWAGEPKNEEEFVGKLDKAIDQRPNIAEMASNPVMLTGLAVLLAHGRDLPERRAELYEWIVEWLINKNKKAESRRRLDSLSELALRMQLREGGRQTKCELWWAEEQLVEAKRFPAKSDAREFLHCEQNDSGIIIPAGEKEIRYWHDTFREFLAALRIKGMLDDEQYRLLVDSGLVYKPEWREVVLLLSGILFKEGTPKAQGLIGAILAALPAAAPLADQARCVGLVGAMVRDIAEKDFAVAHPRWTDLRASVYRIFEDRKSADFDIRLAAADALGQSGDERLVKDSWVTIPAGRFRMGAQKTNPEKPIYDEQADFDESPVREIELPEYRVGKYPVTVGEYRQFLEQSGYTKREYWKAGGFGRFTKPESWERQLHFLNCPVTGVSWFEAAAYCAWKGARLLTEEEWERAARGPEGGKYPWGNRGLNASRANYRGSQLGRVTPVGLYPAGTSSEGLCDLIGNVWEWCADRYIEKEETRVLRGGSSNNHPLSCRASFRVRGRPVGRDDDIGFRLASGPPEQSARPTTTACP